MITPQQRFTRPSLENIPHNPHKFHDLGPILTKTEIADFTDISVQILVGMR